MFSELPVLGLLMNKHSLNLLTVDCLDQMQSAVHILEPLSLLWGGHFDLAHYIG